MPPEELSVSLRHGLQADCPLIGRPVEIGCAAGRGRGALVTIIEQEHSRQMQTRGIVVTVGVVAGDVHVITNAERLELTPHEADELRAILEWAVAKAGEP